MILFQADLYDYIEPAVPNPFVAGGYVPMSIVTLLLVVLIITAWKAPAQVKKVGLITLALGFLWTTVGLIQHADAMQGEDVFVAVNVVWGGLKSHLIPVVYCILVYIVSLVIRIISHLRKNAVQDWLNEIGLFALAVGLLWIPIGLIRESTVMNATGDISPAAIWLGIKYSLIPFACGLVVYIASLIIGIIKTPRSQHLLSQKLHIN